MRRVLLVKTSSLGDVVHNLPVVTDLRNRFADIEIDWAVEGALTDIAALHTGVAQVIAVEPRRWRRSMASRQTWRELRELKARFATRAYDAVIDTQGLIKSASIARMAPGTRYGLDWRSSREPLRLFYHHTFAVPWKQHAVERNRLLAALALDYSIAQTPASYGVKAPPLEEPSPAWAPWLGSEPYAVILHGTSAAAKLWPELQWTKLADYLHHRGLHTVLVWGSPEEEARSERIARMLKRAVIAPRSSLHALAGILGAAQTVFGVDTGLTHLAGALGTPTVGIYCATDPAATGVYACARAINVGAAGHIPSLAEVLTAWDQLPR